MVGGCGFWVRIVSQPESQGAPYLCFTRRCQIGVFTIELIKILLSSFRYLENYTGRVFLDIVDFLSLRSVPIIEMIHV